MQCNVRGHEHDLRGLAAKPSGVVLECPFGQYRWIAYIRNGRPVLNNVTRMTKPRFGWRALPVY